MTSDDRKQAIREHVWSLMEAEHAAPPGVAGNIPDFYGSEKTAAMLRTRDEWTRSRVIKANPDRAQRPIRIQALADEKLLYVAVPRMATPKPFYVLAPQQLGMSPTAAVEAASKGYRSLVAISDMQPIDMVICGSVAVNRAGARLGKGAGYSDLEVALLIEAGLVTEDTVIVAPVHGLQVMNDDLPTSEHDFGVDLIVTPTEVIECPRSPRPTGIVWRHLAPEKIAAIPALAKHPNRTFGAGQ